MSSIPLPDRELTTIDGGVVVTRRPLAYLHGLYDRPRCHATSSDDLVRAAVPYFAVLGVLPTEMPPVAEVHTLPREWVGRVRAKRNLWVWDLTERGRGIVERTVPALMIGVGSYRGLRALRESDERKRRGEPEPSELDAVVPPEVEGLAFAWRLTTSPGWRGRRMAGRRADLRSFDRALGDAGAAAHRVVHRCRRATTIANDMVFSDYYNGSFRQDLASVLANAPSFHSHAGVTLQPRGISNENLVVAGWRKERQLQFAAALFLTVLTDQVCFTHFRDAYSTFQQLTQYPKWRGDCPGACGINIHPGAVFLAIGRPPGHLGEFDGLPVHLLPDDFLTTMKAEVISFVREHLPDVDADAFWNKCDAEIPVHLRLLFVGSRRGRE